MITFSTVERRPWLGHLVGGVEAPHIKLTPLGKVLEATWNELPTLFPGVEVYARQVMPDHFHGLIFFTKHLERSLGQVVAALKGRVTKALGQPLWEAGFHDRILRAYDQLPIMRDYIRDNPRKLALKRAQRYLFRVQKQLMIASTTFTALGNPRLLHAPTKRQVRCSREMTPEACDAYQADLFAAAERGAVLVTPAISPSERAITHEAIARGYPLILLRGRGFPPYYKPHGEQFDACVAGKLLLLAPWSYSERAHLSRAQCLALNRYAALIVAESQTKYPPPYASPYSSDTAALRVHVVGRSAIRLAGCTRPATSPGLGAVGNRA